MLLYASRKELAVRICVLYNYCFEWSRMSPLRWLA